ncbi:MAG: 30S ribosomal protein S27ae [Candidatus Methanophagaceae archaeon]|nr:MAG: 30S ribosomal protein S27ae [Methanophagales archaeon]
MIHSYYEVLKEEDGGLKLKRKRRTCPRCGAGVFLAEHEDRYSCGKCGYTEFRKKR